MTSRRDHSPTSGADTPEDNHVDKLAHQIGHVGHLFASVTKAKELALADYHQYEQAKSVLARYSGRQISGTRVLEIGSGWRSGVTALFHASGALVTGIDISLVGPRASVLSSSMWRHEAFTTIVRRTAARIFIDRAYYNYLSSLLDSPLALDGLDIRVMDASAMEFSDESFEFIYSCAVFEHIVDVAGAAKEIRRVLTRGGIGFISIHLFPSISGGHSVEWRDPDVDRHRNVPPWDHLRRNQFPAGVPLNRLRERDYLTLFGAHLEILDSASKYEGERHLTPEIEQDCRGFSREDLLKTNLRLLVRKV